MTIMAKPPSPQELLQLATEFERELTDNILPYWLKHSHDPKTGFYGEVSVDDVPNPHADRGALLSSRILWMFSSAYINYPDPAYLSLADLAFRDLESAFWDQQHGGLYWTVSSAGAPQETRKHTYGQAFAIYGYSEYFRASGKPEALDRAKELFDLIEQHAFDAEHGGYVEGLGRDWKPYVGEKVDNPVAETEKSQNTHLHVMEAYTNLLRVCDGEWRKKVEGQLRALLDVMFTRILDRETGHLALFLQRDWKVEGDGISYGHDIEAAWLLLEAAEVLGDDELVETTRAMGIKIADVTIEQGIDPTGGVFQEASASKGLTISEKEWWVQAEAVVGFLNAFELSGNVKYFEAAVKVWEFIKAKLIKSGGKEWYWGTYEDGKPLQLPTINLWKCPYHNGRAMIEGSQRLRRVAGLNGHFMNGAA